MAGSLLVTGASGNVGSAVVAAALAQGMDVRVADRDPARTARAWPASVQRVSFDFRDPATWDAALEGVNRVFLLRPPAIADMGSSLNPFVDRALASGVEHVVFLSVAGAERNRWVPHHAVEAHLRQAGIAHTNLRPGFFAQNLGDAYRRDILDDDRLYVPAGRAPVNWVDVRDVAEVAVRVFDAPATHRGRSYTLAGPGPVAWPEVAAILSEVLGRRIRYVSTSIAGYAVHLARRGLPMRAIAVQTVLHVLLRFGQGATCDPTLAELLGRPPRRIEDYIRDHAALWRLGAQVPHP